MNKNRLVGIGILVLLSVVCVFLMTRRSGSEEESPVYIDPHEGMIEVSDGASGTMWITPVKGIETSEFTADGFSVDGEYINYNGTDYIAKRGIDVSEHQGEIEWEAVKGDGVEFAYIRAGYRGFSEGSLNEDAFFTANINGALENGISVGVYFFSQATSISEAVEEAQFLLSLIEGYNVSLPVYFDWERVANVGETRVDGVSGAQMTDFAIAFCNEIEASERAAGVYFYRSQGYFEYELERLSGFELWSAAPGDYPDFYYRHDMWQYAFKARVSGIEGDTDLDLGFEKVIESMPDADIVPEVTDALS